MISSWKLLVIVYLTFLYEVDVINKSDLTEESKDDETANMLEAWKNAFGKDFEFPLAPMGILASGSAHARPSARPPINMSGSWSHALHSDQ